MQLLLAIVGGTGCQPSPAIPTKKIVAATIWPLADIVRQIAGPDIEVHCILPAYASPHTFQPSPKDLQICHRAAIFFQVGRGLDDWVAVLAKQSAHVGCKIVDLSPGCPELAAEEVSVSHDHEHGDCDGHAHEEHRHAAADPHVWMDPILVRDHWLPAITSQLTALFPDRAAVFAANAALLQQRLRETDAQIQELLASLAERKILVVHSSLTYFAKRYRLQVIATIEPWPGKAPSPRYLQKVMEVAKKANTRAIFIEPQLSQKAADILAQELQLQVGTIDPCSVVVSEHYHYQDLLLANAREIKRTLLAAGQGK